ncbi:hypothetical protein [Chitinophaga qingshengii]|uniref:WG repeat-containing protein n=1 Tax=Chitinophaga qingshengii TaxID=1569794 RepID=A0ABR7TQG8_9BACT|nr:hypothetical protein [Chitinophaga qingshengii]MBC9931812.1 hypothetical protein [Chitinophaga qingshengii]
MEHTKPVIVTSLFFDVLMQEFTPLDYLTYDQTTGEIGYYDAYTQDLKPNAFDSKTSGKKELVVTPKIVDGKLKVLIYGNNNNIGFLICKPAADNESAFLEQVKAGKMQVHNNLMAAIKELPAIQLPKNDAANDAVAVNLDGYSLQLPRDKYFIVRSAPGSYQFLPKNGEPESDFAISTAGYNNNDSLSLREFWPVAKEGDLWLSAHPYYAWNTKEKGADGYLLTNSVSVADRYVNITTANKEEVAELFPMVSIFRSLKAEKKGISRDAYNFPGCDTKGVNHTVGALSVTLPANYRLREFSTGGSNFYQFGVTDSLAFSSKDPNSHYNPVEEVDKDGNRSLELADGGVYALKNGRFKTDIGKIVADFEQEGIRVLEQDDNGMLYNYHGSFYLLRYIRKGDTHYVYSMRFKALKNCLSEFCRSRKMFL